MKYRKIILPFFIIFMFGGFIQAQEKNFGVGLIVGEPTGISVKYWMNKTEAFHFSLGYAAFEGKAIGLNADYLFHKYGLRLFDSDEKFLLFYGFGGRLRIIRDNDDSFGARGIIGISWLDKSGRLEVFAETAPGFILIPKTKLCIDAALGFNIYLN